MREAEFEEAKREAKRAAAERKEVEQNLAEELARLRAQPPAVFTPAKSSRSTGMSTTLSTIRITHVDDVQIGGAAERDDREAELASLPKRSIKYIKARDREAQKAMQAAARNPTATPPKSSSSTPRQKSFSPNVGGDSFAIAQAKKAQQIKSTSRNRFNLMSAPDNKASAKITSSTWQCQPCAACNARAVATHASRICGSMW